MKWLTLIALGRLVVWTLQTSGLTKPFFKRHPLLEELRACDFCLGFWVFTPFAWALGLNILDPIYLPVFSEFITGLAVSFGVHLARVGWQNQYGFISLGEE